MALQPRNAILLDDPGLFERDSGCPDCGGLPDLEKAIESGIRSVCPDFFLVPCPPEFEPRWLAGSFPDFAEAQRESAQGAAAARGSEQRPSRVPALDLAIVVVDAARLGSDLWAARTLVERDPDASIPEGHREDDVLDVLFTQIETADLVVLVGTSAAPSTDDPIAEIGKLVGILNQDAIVIPWASGRAAREIASRLGKGVFSNEKSLMAARWCRILEKSPHVGRNSSGTLPGEWIQAFESLETGVIGGVYRRYRPFHPGRLLSMVESRSPAILRSVGVGWVATEPRLAFHWSQAAGGILYFYPEGPWMAGSEGGDWEWDRPEFKDHEKAWDPVHGDRHTTLTLIGTHREVFGWMEALDSCLLTDEEMKSDWSKLEDPIREAMDQELSLQKKIPAKLELIHGLRQVESTDSEHSASGDSLQIPLPLGTGRPRQAPYLRLVPSSEISGGSDGPGSPS